MDNRNAIFVKDKASLCRHVQTLSPAHSTSYPMDTENTPRGKSAGA